MVGFSSSDVKGPDDKDVKLSTQARVWMQEILNFTNSGS